MNDWAQKLSTILQSYHPKDIYNADETAIYFKLMSEKTKEFKSVSCQGGKRRKDRLISLVCSNMTGSDKLRHLVIHKSARPRCFKNAKSISTLYESNTKACMTSELFKDWLIKIDNIIQ